MSDGMIYAKPTDKKRALLLGAMTSEFYQIRTDDEREKIIRCFHQLMQEWARLGAHVLSTFDDDLFMVGEPASSRFTFYLMFEVDGAQTVTDMIQLVREPIDGIRMNRFVRFEARIGRPFFLLEPQGGGS